jgi:hypothetical protein
MKEEVVDLRARLGKLLEIELFCGSANGRGSPYLGMQTRELLGSVLYFNTPPHV